MQSIRSLLFAAVVAIFLFTSSTARAHQPVTEGWCESGTPKVIDMFNFDKEELASLIQSCGIVDIDKDIQDHWHEANYAGQYYCETLVPGTPFANFRVTSVITGPKSFVEKAHHSTYRISEGLSGSCLVCIPSE